MNALICQVSITDEFNKKTTLANVDRIIDEIKKIKTHKIRLIVLPELSTIPYSEDSFKRLSALAEDLKDGTFKKYSQLAKEISSYIVFGIPRFEKDKYFISQVVINDKGEYATHYDKMHIAQLGDSMEKNFFSRGSNICFFEIDNIKFGIIICYDIRFPELCSVLRKKYNVDVILHPSAFTRDVTFYSWKSFVITRALENLVYFVSVNRAGNNWGNSIVCPPWVENDSQLTILDEKERFLEICIDPNLLKKRREEFPLIDDALTSYSELDILWPA